MLVVALTGNIASGKSAVAERMVARGAVLIDADVLAREAVAPGSPALAAIARRWGSGVLDAHGALDRGALRRIVFDAPAELEALNAIVHPRVEVRRQELITDAHERGARIVVCDIPLLFERGMEAGFGVVVLVHAPARVRRERLTTLRGLSLAEADRMMAAQDPAEAKRALADFVIDNDGTLEQLHARTDAVWDELERRADGPHRVS